eukprot:13622139-Alexandrium_andersonii.AAC.1
MHLIKISMLLHTGGVERSGKDDKYNALHPTATACRASEAKRPQLVAQLCSNVRFATANPNVFRSTIRECESKCAIHPRVIYWRNRRAQVK